MNSPAIQATNLWRHYGRTPALRNMELEVPAGRILALLGPNGAGKTTFLKLVMGLIEPTTGHVSVFGHPSRSLPPELAGKIVGMIEGHEPPSWAKLKLLAALQAGATNDFDYQFLKSFCPDRSIWKKSYGALSKGQKRWLLAGLTLASRADLLLLDEPADGLDPAARRSFYDHLRDYSTDLNATCVVATHIISDIERVADDVAIIVRGCIALHESLEDLREQVRELESPGAAPPEFGQGVKVLGSRQIAGSTLTWVKSSLHDAELQRRAGSRSSIRNMTLESLYLITTDRNGNTPAQEERETI